jgi:hypothetical protein
MIVRADVTFNQQGSWPRGKPGEIYHHAALTIQVIGHQARLTGAEVSFGSGTAVPAVWDDSPVFLP